MPGKRMWLLGSLTFVTVFGLVFWGTGELGKHQTASRDQVSTSYFAPNTPETEGQPANPNGSRAAPRLSIPIGVIAGATGATAPAPDTSGTGRQPVLTPATYSEGVTPPSTPVESPIPPEPLPVLPAGFGAASAASPAAVQPAAYSMPLAGNPWSLKLEIADGRTRLEARTDTGIQVKMICDRVNLAYPDGHIEASGNVFLSAGSLDGSCDKMTLCWCDNQIRLSGKVKLKGRHEDQHVELSGDSLAFKLAPTARAPLPPTATAPAHYNPPPIPVVPAVSPLAPVPNPPPVLTPVPPTVPPQAPEGPQGKAPSGRLPVPAVAEHRSIGQPVPAVSESRSTGPGSSVKRELASK